MLASSSPRVRLGLAFLVAALAAVAPSAAAADPFPETIRLPDGFQPEGIASAGGTSLFAGSLVDSAIWAGDVRTGTGAIRVPPHAGRVAVGIKVDHRDRIFVAGGPTGDAYVYDARTGADLASYELAPAGTASPFVNDVVLTREAAYFTDSFNQQLYVVPFGRHGELADQADVRTLPLTGDLVFVPGFNLNGIESANGGSVLILVQPPTGLLFTADPRTGRTRKIDLGDAKVENGDGLLLLGRTLFVVRNFDNRVAVVQLDFRLGSGRVLHEVTDPTFDIPATIAFAAGRLYVVNGRFNIDPTRGGYDGCHSQGAGAPFMRPDSRQRMVQSAALLLRQFGFSGTGFRDVIAHSGAPRGSIYHHFPGGKRQLAEEAVAYAAESVAAAARADDPLAVLRDFLAGWRRTLMRSGYRAGCPVAAVAVEAHTPQLADAAAAAFARWERMLATALRNAGVPRGKSARLATLTVAATEGAIVLCRARRDTRPLDRVERELREAIEAALTDARVRSAPAGAAGPARTSTAG